MSTPNKIFLGLIVVAVVQLAYFYPLMPANVASHFDGAGHANGWSSRAAFFGIMSGMMAMVALMFLGVPRALSRTPDRHFSLPNRDHWLAPERRAETMHVIEEQLSWFGVATLLLILAATQFTIDANLRDYPELARGFMWVFWAYMGYSAVWTVRFVTRFRAPKQRHPA
jgi:uncharacterized membrane protein